MAKRPRAQPIKPAPPVEVEEEEEDEEEDEEDDPTAGFPPPPEEDEPVSDLVAVPAETYRRHVSRGIDPRVARVILKRYENGIPASVDGQWPVEVVTRRWILEKLGPGSYDLLCMNAAGQRVTINRAYITPDLPPPGAPLTGAGAEAPLGGESLERQLMRVMMLKAMNGGQADHADPLREAIGSITKLIALQMQQMQVQLQMAQASPAAQAESQSWKLVHALMQQRQAAPAPAPAPVSPGVEQMTQILNLGLSIGKSLSGAGKSDPDADMSPALRILPDLAESIGQPLLMAIAQAVLPAEKAKAVADMMRAQAEVRAAEAAAPDTDDAEG